MKHPKWKDPHRKRIAELEAEVAAHRELLIRWADMAQHMGLGETNLHRESKALLEGKG